MAEFKIVLGLANGKSVQAEIKEEVADALIGKKIGDTVSGDSLGYAGYEFKITGGSDYAGFPMRADIDGPERKKIFAAKSFGIKTKRAGQRLRKTLAGNTIHEQTAQINLKVVKEGKEPLIKEEAADAAAEGDAAKEA